MKENKNNGLKANDLESVAGGGPGGYDSHQAMDDLVQLLAVAKDLPPNDPRKKATLKAAAALSGQVKDMTANELQNMLEQGKTINEIARRFECN